MTERATAVFRHALRPDFAKRFSGQVLRIVRETEKAMLLSDGANDSWVPRSLIRSSYNKEEGRKFLVLSEEQLSKMLSGNSHVKQKFTRQKPIGTVPYSHLSAKYRRTFEQCDSVAVVRETEKAYLMQSKEHQAWVPKSAISAANALMSDREAMEASSKEASKLIEHIDVPLKHAPDGMYAGLLELPLDRHQRDIIYTLGDAKRVYLGMEQGTGKTPTSLARVLLFDDDRKVLIVCEKSLVAQWKSEIRKFCPQLEERTTVINYDVIWRDSRQELMSQFHDGNYHLILEEVGVLGNELAKRTAKSIELAKDAYSVQMLSGSFFGGRFEKFYPCAVMQGFNGTRNEFEDLFTVKVPVQRTIRTKYGIRHVEDKQIVGYKNIDKLVSMTAELGAVFVRIKDCIDMPEQKFYDVVFDSSKEANRIESRMRKQKDMPEQDAQALFVKYRAANSVAGNKDKLDWIANALSTIDSRVCIFYMFNEERQLLIDMVKASGRPMSEVSGNVKDLDAFRKHSNAVALLQIVSASKGLNLQEASYSIFTSPFPPESVMQAEFRTWRRGQKHTCIYYTLHTDSAIDKGLMRNLEVAKANVDNIG